MLGGWSSACSRICGIALIQPFLLRLPARHQRRPLDSPAYLLPTMRAWISTTPSLNGLLRHRTYQSQPGIRTPLGYPRRRTEEDYLLWNAVDVPATFAPASAIPDCEHYCIAILYEGVLGRCRDSQLGRTHRSGNRNLPKAQALPCEFAFGPRIFGNRRCLRDY